MSEERIRMNVGGMLCSLGGANSAADAQTNWQEANWLGAKPTGKRPTGKRPNIAQSLHNDTLD